MMLHNRSGEAAAKLLQDIHGPRDSGGLVYRIIGAGSGIAVVIESSAMDAVAARTSDDVDKTCSGPAIFRAVRRDRDLKFLDSVLAENIRKALTATCRSEVIAGCTCAVYGEGVCAVGIG